MEQRNCLKCNETKKLDEFAKVYCAKSRGKNYYQHTCLICFRAFHAAKERKRRKENPEQYRQARRKHRDANLDHCRELKRKSDRKLKIRVFSAYGGFECACCFEVEPTMLTIDHVNNDGSKHRKEVLKHQRYRSGGDSIYRWLEKNNFPEGFQVLCYNCNISKHRNGGMCSHKLREGSSTISKESTLKRAEAQSILMDEDIVRTIE